MGAAVRLVAAFAFSLYAFVGAAIACQGKPPEVVGSPPPADKADISVDATVHASSVRYDVVDKKRILHVGGPSKCGGYRIDRTNIPQHPRPGVTYRNVTVHLRLAANFVNEGRTSNTACSQSAGPRPLRTPLPHS